MRKLWRLLWKWKKHGRKAEMPKRRPIDLAKLRQEKEAREEMLKTIEDIEKLFASVPLVGDREYLEQLLKHKKDSITKLRAILTLGYLRYAQSIPAWKSN